ncbi:hypothetical protein CKN63_13305 [Carnobacterium divergens]|uniref:hypothetical protein n=1 Tax=Carnobacterium divergens TaxID=2748 RepID=UPI0010716B1C|nr:hypothetical protein [Carnobacterium divergens]TFI60537.1 hypothetical protein CKN59_13240 [Carnobacterium divergens]TFI61663.1 hypothetical protein CKN76_12745 [Carnobacterium divergens]TFJ01012.1 hypothetical protein CKN75_12830 [Carnobacterium divergens]TFJ08932.1 hypothetical protein CKN71_12845 [Carnobacterium divergens]TFJ15641.1 hypothetical protein CKN63_13305 [Carnobacterium divergens]
MLDKNYNIELVTLDLSKPGVPFDPLKIVFDLNKENPKRIKMIKMWEELQLENLKAFCKEEHFEKLIIDFEDISPENSKKIVEHLKIYLIVIPSRNIQVVIVERKNNEYYNQLMKILEND